MTTQLTLKETIALCNLVTNNYDGGAVWSWAVMHGEAGGGHIVTDENVAGVISSLSKKGIVSCHGEGEDAYIKISKVGYAAYEDLEQQYGFNAVQV